MTLYKVAFTSHNRSVRVEEATTLLQAAARAGIVLNNLCGGDGLCGNCRMKIKQGSFQREDSHILSESEIADGIVLACITLVEDDLAVETGDWATETGIRASEKFLGSSGNISPAKKDKGAPFTTIIKKVYLELATPSLMDNTADQQRVCNGVKEKLAVAEVDIQPGLLVTLPAILRRHNFCITVLAAQKGERAVIYKIEAGNTSKDQYLMALDLGTTTLAGRLLCPRSGRILAGAASFNSQGIYGREVTARLIAAEKKGSSLLQERIVADINELVAHLCRDTKLSAGDIVGMIVSGNTTMIHFLWGLPGDQIRRAPYIPVSVDPSPANSSELGINISCPGVIYPIPGISGWVGGDITAGIWATGIAESNDISLLADIGTNGEIVIGNREWLVACSASAGPALEGASVECGKRAEPGAIEHVYIQDGEINYQTIDDLPATGLCGSGIIDLIAVLLDKGLINRAGKFVENSLNRFNLTDSIFITEIDIENIITAKAAIYAAIKNFSSPELLVII